MKKKTGFRRAFNALVIAGAMMVTFAGTARADWDWHGGHDRDHHWNDHHDYHWNTPRHAPYDWRWHQAYYPVTYYVPRPVYYYPQPVYYVPSYSYPGASFHFVIR